MCAELVLEARFELVWLVSSPQLITLCNFKKENEQQQSLLSATLTGGRVRDRYIGEGFF